MGIDCLVLFGCSTNSELGRGLESSLQMFALSHCLTNLRLMGNFDVIVPLPAVGSIMNVGGVSEAGPSTSLDRPNTVPILLYHATFQKHVDDIKLDRAQARTDFCRQKDAARLVPDR